MVLDSVFIALTPYLGGEQTPRSGKQLKLKCVTSKVSLQGYINLEILPNLSLS